jgi:hypothetical protein
MSKKTHGKNGTALMPFRKRAAHLFDQPDRPETDSIGRTNPNSDQLAELAQRLKTFRRLISEEQGQRDISWDATPEARRERKRVAKENCHNGNGERQRDPVPGAFGRLNREREY